MSDIGSEIIVSKLSPPSASHPWIPLKAIEGGLPRLLEVPLTVVTAPAGFGKTTQLALWHKALATRGVATAWLTLDADDDEIHQFFTYLLEALHGPCEAGVERARELIRNDPLLSYRRVLSVLLNEIGQHGGPVVLFLDDVHLLASPTVNDYLYRLVRYAPDTLHVVTAGRTEPLIHVSRFQSQRHLYRLDADDLRFTEADVQRFFAEVVGQPLAVDEASTLWRLTEGWVAGIQLASITHHAQRDGRGIADGLAGASHEISVYLTENVLADMPASLVDFMLRVSVFDRLSGPLAAHATGVADAAGLLEQLAQRNLFLAPLDDRHEWYRFHALFLDYLRARARREMPERLVEVHDRASEYFAAAGRWQEAVRHALAAGQDSKAAGWVERCAMDLIHRSALRTVIGWLGRLPERVVEGSVRLRLAQAWAYALGLQPGDAVKTLASLERDLASGRLPSPADTTLKTEILSVRAITAGLTDDSTESVGLARQVLALGTEPGSWVERIAHTALVFGLAYENGFEEARELHARVKRNHGGWHDEPTYAGVYQQCMFGLSALIEGRLIDAEAAFASALRRGEDEVGMESAAAVLPAGYLSTILYEWDELSQVESLLKGRLSTALSVCANGSVSRFAVSQIRLLRGQGKLEQALHVIERATRVARERGWLRLLSACQAEAIQLMLDDGAVLRANRTLDVLLRSVPRRTPTPPGSYIEVRFNLAMSMARVMASKGYDEDAELIIGELCPELEALGCQYHLAHARILLATVLERGGKGADADAALAAALGYGQRNGLVRAVADGDPCLAEVLARLRVSTSAGGAGAGLDAWYLADLTDRLGGVSTPSPPRLGSDADGVLRPREHEILVLLASGLSNKAIAQKLCLSPETVKWHFKNIFRKLDVSSRVQAVRWAQEHLQTVGGATQAQPGG